MFPIQDSIPRRCPPLMNWAIMATCIVVFLFEISLPPHVLERLFYLFGVVPARYTHPDWAASVGLVPKAILPLFTCMFLHGSWVHIIGNMWTLWIFGDNVEDEMGPLRYLLFYLFCGIVASLVQIYTNPNSTIPTIGASGAIAGVMGAYFLLFPRARIIIMIPILFFPFFFDVPALFFLAFWFLEQVFSGAFSLLSPEQAGGIAWWAHAGGFLCGMLSYRFFLHKGICRRRYPDQMRPWGVLDSRERF